MRQLTYYLIILIISSGCSEYNTEWKAERAATIDFGTAPKNENFILSFHKRGDTLNYKYVSIIDSTKHISIQKIAHSNTLFFGFDKFIRSDRPSFRNPKLNDLEFDYYDLETPIMDGTGPILYNLEYGLLAINNVYGPTIIFLEEKDNNLTEQIVKQLNK
ncbi:hypothetical protein [uncultured Gelidibacter sp.]|uniref:hypothetical protein n=1 Tax=uncultured Gelidibacter sp. TaxID=259318 RepID=UPI002608C82E|nr:hypothetical protein [uncultured Gelidibacter sp.]